LVVHELKRVLRDGTTQLLFEPLSFLSGWRQWCRGREADIACEQQDDCTGSSSRIGAPGLPRRNIF
jgi:hypothetical protein